jgi:hypothetical protein
MDFFNNKYSSWPVGGGINYGIALTKTGEDSLFREFSISYRCPTSTTPIANITNVFRVLPYVDKTATDPTKMKEAKLRFENSNIDIVATGGIRFCSTFPTTVQISSIAINPTNTLTLQQSNDDIYTGMPVIYNTTTTEPRAFIANNPTVGFRTGAGTITVTAGSPGLVGTGTSFTISSSTGPNPYFGAGAIMTFGNQYAYTVQSITNDTNLTLTENVYANGSLSNQKWCYTYPPDNATYNGKIANLGEYFVIKINPTTIQLALTYDNAMKGIPIIIYTSGAGIQSLTYNRYTNIQPSTNMTQNSTFVLPVNNQTFNSILSTNPAGDSYWTNTPTLNQVTCNGTGSFGSVSSTNGVISQGNIVVSQGGIQYGPTGPAIQCINGTYTGLLIGKDSGGTTRSNSTISGT